MTLYTRSPHDVAILVIATGIAISGVLVFDTAVAGTEVPPEVVATLRSTLLVVSAALCLTSFALLAVYTRKELAVRGAIGRVATIELAGGTTVRGKVEINKELIEGRKVKVTTEEGAVTGEGYGKPPKYFLRVVLDDGRIILVNARKIKRIECDRS